MEQIPYKELGKLVDKAVADYIDKHFVDVNDVPYGEPVTLTPEQERLVKSLATGMIVAWDVCRPIMPVPVPTNDMIQCLQFNRRVHGNN